MKIRISGQENIIVRLEGKLTEGAELGPTSGVPVGASIDLDLVGLKAIDAAGLRHFREWCHSLRTEHLRLSYCPRFFIDQLNLVADLVPKNTRVMSFYVPYYSQVSGEQKEILFIRGQEFGFDANPTRLNLPNVTDTGGHVMEMDTQPERYFAFLVRFS